MHKWEKSCNVFTFTTTAACTEDPAKLPYLVCVIDPKSVLLLLVGKIS